MNDSGSTSGLVVSQPFVYGNCILDLSKINFYRNFSIVFTEEIIIYVMLIAKVHIILIENTKNKKWFLHYNIMQIILYLVNRFTWKWKSIFIAFCIPGKKYTLIR